MAILGFDTSTTVCSVAVATEEKLLVEHTVNLRRAHSETLMPTVDQVLQQAELTLSDCQGIAVVTGPGSFTGLRIGLATAKGLSFSTQLPILTVTSLEVLAHNLIHTSLPVCSLLPAQRGELYIGIFSCRGTYPQREHDYFIGKVEDLRPLMADKEFIAVGEGAARFKQDLAEAFGEQVKFLPPSHSRNRGSLVSSLGWLKLHNKDSADIISLEPFYMRLSSAERRRKHAEMESRTC